MNKEQALYSFWSQFNLPAYDENSVPDDAVMPYITYNVVTDSLDAVLPMSARLWYNSTKWEEISLKSAEIALTIGDGVVQKLDSGYMWIYKGTPFAQRMSGENDNVKMIYINIGVEFLTAV